MTSEKVTPFATGVWTRDDLAYGLASLDGVTLQDIRSTAGPRDYVGRADDLLAYLSQAAAGRATSQAKPAAKAEWRHLARQFDLMAKGCKSMGLHSVEDDFDRLRQSAMKAEVTADELVELIDYDYRTGQDGRAAAQLIFQALLADLSAAVPATSQAHKEAAKQAMMAADWIWRDEE